MITLDASAIVKLALNESRSDMVYSIVNGETSKMEAIFAPDVIVAEALNAIWASYAVKKRISEQQADEAFGILRSILDNIDIIPSLELADLATDISKTHRLSVYDSLYVAASMLNSAPLLTFDKEVLAKAADIGVSISK